MGSRTFLPTSLYQCFDDTDDGRIDPLKYMQYVMSQQRELDERDNLVIIAACEAAAAAESTAEGKSSSPPPRKRARRDPQMTRERTTKLERCGE